jgi:hypothetical protein
VKTVETHTMPANWASALINNDKSGLSPSELNELDAYIDMHRELQNPVSCSDESTIEQFTFWPGNTLLCDCLIYSFLRG